MDMVMVGPNPIRLIIIYRPPPSCSNGLTSELFFTEFRTFLEEINNEPGHLLITGDFNFHTETSSNPNSKKLLELINIFNLKQHVQQPTHMDNHTLDLIITRNDDGNIVRSICVRDPGISDHCSVHAKICLEKPSLPRKEIKYRYLKGINYDHFRNDIENSPLVRNYTNCHSITDLTGKYETTLRSILDSHAPLKKKIVTLRPVSPWYTEDIHQLKLTKRRLERRWRASRLQVDREIYTKHCQHVNTMMSNSKMTFYSSMIDQHKDDQKVLFSVVNKMLYRTPEKLYPSSESSDKLSNDFADFFTHKIEKIRDELVQLQSTSNPAPDITFTSSTDFTEITPVSEDELRTGHTVQHCAQHCT